MSPVVHKQRGMMLQDEVDFLLLEAVFPHYDGFALLQVDERDIKHCSGVRTGLELWEVSNNESLLLFLSHFLQSLNLLLAFKLESLHRANFCYFYAWVLICVLSLFCRRGERPRGLIHKGRLESCCSRRVSLRLEEKTRKSHALRR